MNINLRALVFGTAVAAALTVTINVVAAEAPQVIRLDTVEIVRHRDVAAVDGALQVTRLDTVVVTGRRTA